MASSSPIPDDAERLSQKAAEMNFVKVAQSLPSALVERENSLQKTFATLSVNDLDKLRWLYGFMDELAEVVEEHTPCAPGCDACCHYAVTVSELEVQLIEAEGLHTRLESHEQVDHVHGTPCPLLQDRKCTVYAVRPFACRHRITLDASAMWCAPEACHDIELPQMNFSEVTAIFAQLAGDASESADIREWFGKAKNKATIEDLTGELHE